MMGILNSIRNSKGVDNARLSPYTRSCFAHMFRQENTTAQAAIRAPFLPADREAEPIARPDSARLCTGFRFCVIQARIPRGGWGVGGMGCVSQPKGACCEANFPNGDCHSEIKWEIRGFRTDDISECPFWVRGSCKIPHRENRPK